MNERRHRQSWFWILAILLPALACGPLTSDRVDQARDTVATAGAAASTANAVAGTVRAQAATAAPSIREGAGDAIKQAATRVAALATDAPTIRAGIGERAEQVATLSAQASSQGAGLIATVQASDVDLTALGNVLGNAQAESDGSYTITITDAQLNQLIRLKQTVAGDLGQLPGTSDLRFSFHDGLVLLNGEMLQPIGAPLLVIFRPYSDDGLQFELIDASIAGVDVPASVVDGAGTALNATLGRITDYLPTGTHVTGVIVANGSMIISAGP